jgi:phosphomannomutase
MPAASPPQDLRAQAEAWLALDPDPATRAALSAAISAGDAALAPLFAERLAFGTAGIRGEMGPGPARMNRVMVRQSTLGFARYLQAQVPGAAGRGVVVGYDGRRNSRAFAEDAAAVLLAAGFRVWLSDGVLSTPALAFSVPALRAAGGVMVTASHNPPADNGYKVYWSTGGQIVPPHDAGILAEIEALLAAGGATPTAALDGAGDRLQPLPAALEADYHAQVLAQRVHPDAPDVRAVYTAMHGVGYAPLRRLLVAAGRAPVLPVPAQVEPDGAFPTVAFPNPEEPGALDLAIAEAQATGAALILANDPDADRLAVAIPDGRGGWRQLTGNEVGLLLADDLLAHGPADGDRLVACSVVSSPLLHEIARAHGARSVDTLTGFKWLADAALRHEAQGGRFVLGFEEALGYSAGPVVRDKDGVSAALLMLDLAGHLAAQGRTLGDALDELAQRIGLASSGQRSVKIAGADFLARRAALMRRLRDGGAPTLGGRPVALRRDLLAGVQVDLRSGEARPEALPQSDVLIYELEPQGDELGVRIIVRPSGTEPKVKVYVDHLTRVSGPVGPARAAAKAAMTALLDAVAADLQA